MMNHACKKHGTQPAFIHIYIYIYFCKETRLIVLAVDKKRASFWKNLGCKLPPPPQKIMAILVLPIHFDNLSTTS
jgi:hypothetical protein